MTTRSDPAITEAQAREMARFGITHDGRGYCYGEYRYDRLEDAIAYALEVRRAG
jgi:hypothetical protein